MDETLAEVETVHATVNGELCHVRYLHLGERGKVSWRKLPGEKPCDCSNREEDRKALKRIKETANV